MTAQLIDARGEPYTLMIVDDDDIAREAVTRAIGKLGIANRVEQAEDGLAALEALERGEVPPPSLLLLDLSMPRLDGIGLLTRLRTASDPALSAIPVVVITTSTRGSELAQVRDLDAIPIEKGPDLPAALSSALTAVLS